MNARARLAKLWAGNGNGVPPGPPAVRLLDLPGFRRFEDCVLAHDPRLPWHEASDSLSIETFGITYRETLYYDGWEPADELPPDAYRSFLQGKKDYERKLEVQRAVYDEDRVNILMRLGIDFRDEHGKPLRCTKAFCRQAEFAIRFRSWKPKHVFERDDVMGSKLEREAAEWRASRRG